MRLAGINIPDNKRIEISLTYIYGVGRSLAQDILKSADIDAAKKPTQLTPEEVNKIKEFIEKKYKIEGELRQLIKSNIKRLKEIRCYRGARHERKLPVRGQRKKKNGFEITWDKKK